MTRLALFRTHRAVPPSGLPCLSVAFLQCEACLALRVSEALSHALARGCRAPRQAPGRPCVRLAYCITLSTCQLVRLGSPAASEAPSKHTARARDC